MLIRLRLLIEVGDDTDREAVVEHLRRTPGLVAVVVREERRADDERDLADAVVAQIG